MSLRPVDIWTNSTYRADGGREYFVEGIRNGPDERVVDYAILSGPETGKRLTASLADFARRVTKRLPQPSARKPKKGGIG